MIHALAITGPTASGKTALSLDVAEALGCEIISLDSMQIYKYMDIGTAKATKEERARAAHHMLDILDPDESFSAEAYKEMAMRCAEDISARGKIPLFVGGTGLYLSTLLRPECEKAPESDPEYRRKAEEYLDEAKKIALHDRRVIRALEIYDATGKTKTYFDELTKRKSDEISLTHVTLDFHERENLYKRVNMRVDIMLREGLLIEVSSLLDKGHLAPETTAAQAIGYKELIDVIKGEKSLEVAADQIKQFSRNYAKRQLTWFRHTDGAIAVKVDTEGGEMRKYEDILAECINVFSKALQEQN